MTNVKLSEKQKEVIDGRNGKLVWAWMENETATHSALHCYYSRQRKDSTGMYTGERHDGNSALCNRRYGISEDGDSFLQIDKIEPSELIRTAACKKCLKIYDRLKSLPLQ